MRRPLLALVLGAMCALGAARPAAAQAPHVPLEQFVAQVAWLWGMSDVAALVDLLPEQQRVVLDTGSGTEAVTARHAAAALRELFEGRETVAARPVRVTISGGSPPRGFGELAWQYRARGAAPTLRSVYVAAVWDGSGWRVNELRLMR